MLFIVIVNCVNFFFSPAGDQFLNVSSYSYVLLLFPYHEFSYTAVPQILSDNATVKSVHNTTAYFYITV